MREIRISGLGRRLAIDVALIVLLALAGPFGTFVELSGPHRFVYWAVAVGGCSVLVQFAVAATLATPWLAKWPTAPRIGLGAMLAAFPGAALIGLLERAMRGNRSLVEDYFWLWFCVALIGFFVALFQFRVFGPLVGSAPAVSSQGEAAGARFLDRLPREIGRDIVSLSMQDHYVRVTAAGGSAMVLIRFAEAVRELGDYPGAQVHRSHWVAAGKAKRVLRRRDRVFVELADGRELPVSRPYLDDARRLAETDPSAAARTAPAS